MYKIYKYLFGWDYIHWKNSADYGIARVFKTKTEVIKVIALKHGISYSNAYRIVKDGQMD